MKTGDIVIIARLENNWEEHYFLVDEVHEDSITGTALTGDFAGSYGEPDKTTGFDHLCEAGGYFLYQQKTKKPTRISV